MFNWVGNKIKYIDIIKKYTEKFDTIIDPMMGSGNYLIELSKNKNIIGSDILKLMPMIYSNFNKFDIDIETFKSVSDRWNNFSVLESYYDFRKYWNKKYINNQFDNIFLIETFLLLKLCSNSMIRFNKSGEFNQGFRGIKLDSLGNPTSFFSHPQFQKFQSQLYNIKQTLSGNTTKQFLNMDMRDFIKLEMPYNNFIFIFDPPYILDENAMYSTNQYTEQHDANIFNFIETNNIPFLYFNFKNRNGIQYKFLDEIIKNNKYICIELNDKSYSGQNRTQTSEITEIIVTNINLNDSSDNNLFW